MIRRRRLTGIRGAHTKLIAAGAIGAATIGGAPKGVTAQERQPPSTEFDIRGAWAPEVYVLEDGTRHRVSGRIFFTDSEWQVLFYVMEGDDPRRGSGEGGTYTLEGNRLVFTHLFHLSAGEAMGSFPERPVRMEARAGEGPVESTRIEIDGERLVIHFPSGNTIEFRRSSGPP